MRACVHDNARAMWDARTDHVKACRSLPGAGASIELPRPSCKACQSCRIFGFSVVGACKIHAQRAKYAGSQEPCRDQGPCKSQGTKGKDQEPKTKSLPCMDPRHAGTKDQEPRNKSQRPRAKARNISFISMNHLFQSNPSVIRLL